ncbi:hypothetical protein Q5752_001809 [Cryptotrichosporon argae]
MHVTLRALAATTEALPFSVSQASVQLVPPIPLYRRLLRAHRHLPPEMRFMGDAYIKSEFRATRSTDNPLHIIAFLSQWKAYLDALEPQVAAGQGAAWAGRRLDTALMDTLSDEQVGQLYELMHATRDVWKSPEQLEKEAQAAELDAGETVASTDAAWTATADKKKDE